MTLRYTSRLGPAARLFLFAAGLVPLLAPYELLMRPDWSTFASPAFVFALAISAAAVAVSALMLAAAIAGVDEEVRFDPAGREVIHRTRSPVTPVRERRYPFAGVAALGTQAVQWDSREDTFRLTLVTSDKRSVSFGTFDTREEAERAGAELRTLLQSEPADGPGAAPDAGRRSGTESNPEEY